MRTYATAQLIGSRTAQCDATAVATAPTGARAYVLLDGIGSSATVREWTRTAARRLARAAAQRGDASDGLRAVYNRYAAEPDRCDPYRADWMPKAAAVVAVTAPGRPLTVAWCGDARAYVLDNGGVRRLTQDHNLRRVYPPNDIFPAGNRNVITSWLGGTASDMDLLQTFNHRAIETATVDEPCRRLLLASDGAYEPLEDQGVSLASHLVGDVAPTARRWVTTAVDLAGEHADNATVLVADLAP